MTDFFLAGIIQGSIAESRIHSQDYRTAIQEAIERAVPGASVYCPVTEFPNSLTYDEDKSRPGFFSASWNALRQTDVLVAFLPEASMGTAIEMWQAYHAGQGRSRGHGPGHQLGRPLSGGPAFSGFRRLGDVPGQ